MTKSNNNPILQMKNIHVYYDDIKALKGVDFDLYKGEIHALVGEHRAGKSTLVKLLSGAVKPIQGEIIFNNKKIDYFSPISSMKSGIGMVYQNINIIPSLNVIENIFAGQMIKTWYGRLNYTLMLQKTKELFKKLKTDINYEVPLGLLSEGEQQIVEIARVLSLNPSVIIFDEISSKLTPNELENIYRIIFEYKTKDRSIIYISHNMDEIFEFADRVTILKDGYRRGTEEIKNLDKIKLIKLTYSFMLTREELKQDNKKLYFFKKYNENIIKNLPIGVIILDDKNKIYLINYAAVKILEIENLNVTDENMKIIFNNENIEEADKILEQIKLKKKFRWEELDYKEDKKIKINIFPFKDENYIFLGTIILIEDITKDSYFKNYLLRTEKIASVAQLAAGIAHEINNPLGIIINYITLLKRKNLDNDGSEKLKKMEKELNRIAEIISSLLSFSKLRQATLKKVNLVSIIDDVVILINHKIIAKRINLIWHNNIKEVFIMGNENRIKQVLINLLVNSIEAVLAGGKIKIKLHIDKLENQVVISIIDNGYGIPDNIKDKIFDPFFSSKVSKNNTGLGLAICKQIIESHHGHILCDNKEQETSFNVTLPMIKWTKEE